MKSVIVCDPEYYQDEMIGYKTTIDNTEYLFSIADIPSSDYYSTVDSHSVVVEIIAFSCNYRDKGVLRHFHRSCKTQVSKDECLYSFFGSEFVGKVVEIGKEVRDIQIGDRVMADNSYPYKVDNFWGGVVTNYASQRVQVFHDSCLVKVPNYMSDIEAAAFSLTASTAHSLISKSQIKAGDKILVTSMFSNTSLGCLELLKNIPDIDIYVLSTHTDDALPLVEYFKIKKIFRLENFIDAKQKQIYFDVIIDPFADLHINYLTSSLNFNSRYITCGVTSQMMQGIESYGIIANIIRSNSMFIGNCLGTHNDLQIMLDEYNHNRYKVHIDSVYSGERIVEFINRSFNFKHLGKVVYSYK